MPEPVIRLDIEKVKREADLASIAESFGVKLSRRRNEHVALCPFHAEDTPSFHIYTEPSGRQKFHCFGCGKHGDVIDFVRKHQGVTFQEAVEIITGSRQADLHRKEPETLPRDDIEVPRVITPVPAEAPDLMDANGFTIPLYRPRHKDGEPERKRYRPSVVYPYRSVDGELMGYILRLEFTRGDRTEKIMVPATWCRFRDGREEWTTQTWPDPRPLYRGETLGRYDTRRAFVAEGEKATDRAAELIGEDWACVCWPGGTNSWKYADWSPLAGWTVVLSPDNDDPGLQCMQGLAGHLIDLGCTVYILPPPADAPKGWDIADEDGLTPDDLRLWIDDRVMEASAFFGVLGSDIAADAVPDGDEPDSADDAVLEGIEDRIREDATIVFADQIVSALARLRGRDERRYQQIKLRVKESPVSLKDFEKAVEDRRRQLEGEQTDGEHPELDIFTHPIRALGYDRGTYYYLSSQTHQVVALAPKEHAGNHLFQLAPKAYWEQRFPSDKSGIDFTTAADVLMGECHEIGVFDGDRLRGRGAWRDRGHIVLHLGDRLVVDGNEVGIDSYRGEYIYERDKPLPHVPLDNPLSDQESQRVLEICQMPRWENPLFGVLLAGGIALGPVCGALPWRSHLWLTGGSGSGKSWLLSQVVRPLMGSFGLYVQSTSTEAGIRQGLRTDALPIVFDEAEAEDERARIRIQQVLELMRQASSETGGVILKGSGNQTKRVYATRSMFILGSIQVSLKQQADLNRVAILSLQSPPDARDKVAVAEARERFRQLSRMVEDTINAEFAMRLMARTTLQLPTIIHNIDVCTSAAAQVLGSQRLGDQYGVLLAGAWSLGSSAKLDIDSVIAWMNEQDWEASVGHAYERDEQEALNILLGHTLTVDLGNGVRQQRTIGDLVYVAAYGALEDDDFLPRDVADATLRRLGLMVSGRRLYIANKSSGLSEVFAHSSWGVNWNNVLKRVPGGQLEGTKYFSRGVQSRSVSLPVEQLFQTAEHVT